VRKTYRTKRTALAAAHGKEVYKVVGGYRISRGAKVRGKRGRALKRRIAKRTKSKKRKKAKRKKPLKYIKIKLGNPNPRVCGFS
jgi:hypothetical protein